MASSSMIHQQTDNDQNTQNHVNPDSRAQLKHARSLLVASIAISNATATILDDILLVAGTLKTPGDETHT